MAVLAAPSFSVAFDFSSLLKSDDTPRFKIVHVDNLVRLRALPQQKLVVLDANYAPVREQEGVIPGAVLLSSESNYDVAKELPRDKTTKLVFYCHNKA
jgi:rhodanese-related sulfurtransferase